MADKLTHFNAKGDAHMVDVGSKDKTHRVAVCGGQISMQATTLAMIEDNTHKKGDVLQVARIAGIMAAKKTAELIPLCHPISITHISVDFEIDAIKSVIHCIVRCETRERTGIEMEALTACNITLLTIYDMCKAVDRGMVISAIKLLEKSGGKSGDFKA